jgi:hypothetical protein
MDKKSESAYRSLQSSAVNPWLGLTEVTNPLKNTVARDFRSLFDMNQTLYATRVIHKFFRILFRGDKKNVEICGG